MRVGASTPVEDLTNLFERKVDVPRIRHVERQTLDTLICEEALLLAKYLGVNVTLGFLGYHDLALIVCCQRKLVMRID